MEDNYIYLVYRVLRMYNTENGTYSCKLIIKTENFENALTLDTKIRV